MSLPPYSRETNVGWGRVPDQRRRHTFAKETGGGKKSIISIRGTSSRFSAGRSPRVGEEKAETERDSQDCGSQIGQNKKLSSLSKYTLRVLKSEAGGCNKEKPDQAEEDL